MFQSQPQQRQHLHQQSPAFSKTLTQTVHQPTQQQQQQLSATQRIIATTSPSSSSSPPVDSTQRATTTTSKQKPYSIGSRHVSRINYGAEEKVFHRNDVPPKAREAHDYVQRFIHPPANSSANWDSSTVSGIAINGSKHCSWETTSDVFDDRYYHQLEADYLISKAQTRMRLIREGRDPDEDTSNVGERWNISTYIKQNDIPALGSRKGLLPQSDETKQIKHLPSDYKSLLQQQVDSNLYTRYQKDLAAEERALQVDIETNWMKWRKTEHVDGAPSLPPLPVKRKEKEKVEIGERLEKEYNQEVLREFVEKLEGGIEDQNTNNEDQQPRYMRYAPRTTTHHSHRHSSSSRPSSSPDTSSNLPFSTSVPPAWYRAEARSEQIRHAKQEAPYPKYVHVGVYEWKEGGEKTKRSDNNEVKEQTEEGSYFWSCCSHPLRDARGCTATEVDTSKRRIVLARSDDPASVAALGMSSMKSYTTNGGGVTANEANISHGLGLSGPGVAIVKRYGHTGRYEACAATKEIMWSCCGAADASAQGCTKKTVTKEHRWQVDSA